MSYSDIARALKATANPIRAIHAERFFRTGKGEYGEGDVFLGQSVPTLRNIAKQYRDASRKDIETLLKSKFHEFRLTALLIMVSQFNRGNEKTKESIYHLYLSHTAYINNWDLVDSSAHKIVGAWLLNKDTAPHSTLARSKQLWERRIAIVATWWFIRAGTLKDTFALSDILLHDSHDLIHKAVGWMLREAGKKDSVQLEAFLAPRYKTMPRTMLRYAIEKFPERERKMYLKGLV